MPGEMMPVEHCCPQVVLDSSVDPGLPQFDVSARGVGIIPLEEAGDAPLVMISREVDPPLVWAGLAPPFCGLVEQDENGGLPGLAEVVDAVRAGGIGLSLSTASAFHATPSEQVAAALSSRFLLTDKQEWALDLAIQEAVANALIHGNLGIESDMREKFERLKAFNALLTARLSDKTLARRRIIVTATPKGAGFAVTVADEGDGFDADSYLCRAPQATDKLGRGLGLMRWLSSQMTFADCGRRVTMHFPLA